MIGPTSISGSPSQLMDHTCPEENFLEQTARTFHAPLGNVAPFTPLSPMIWHCIHFYALQTFTHFELNLKQSMVKRLLKSK